jgi:hypothetical protein
MPDKSSLLLRTMRLLEPPPPCKLTPLLLGQFSSRGLYGAKQCTVYSKPFNAYVRIG